LLLSAGGAIGVALLLVSQHERPERLIPRFEQDLRDPFAFTAGRVDRLEQAAAFGLSHVLYAKSPGGVVASAERTAQFRPLIEAAAGDQVDPELLEALVFLESAGRPEVIAGSDPAGAAGLTQIVAETGANFLGMHIDLVRSRRLAKAIAVAEARGDAPAVERLRAARRRADTRFDPAQALAATVRYLTVARERFGRDDLALVSYHMGIGNLDDVLRSFAAATDAVPIADVVREHDLSYARVFFDSSPRRHVEAWARLARLGDSSRDYYWRLLASAEIMRLFRDDRAELERLAALHAAAASAEQVLHPPGDTRRYDTPADLEEGWQRHELHALADDARTHLRVHPVIGRRATAVGADPALYRNLRAEALALLLYLARRTYEIGGARAPLTITAAVEDEQYQQLPPIGIERPSHRPHATGYAFDISRRYESAAQAAAFQFMLERLQTLGLIAWHRDPAVIHVTVSDDAAPLVTVMLRPARSSQPAR
jgi:hypothetical protein